MTAFVSPSSSASGSKSRIATPAITPPIKLIANCMRLCVGLMSNGTAPPSSDAIKIKMQNRSIIENRSKSVIIRKRGFLRIFLG